MKPEPRTLHPNVMPPVGPSSRSAVDPFIAMEVVAATNAMIDAGEDVISMAVGQPGAPAPACARQAAAAALEAGDIGYTNATGISSLRRRLARYYEERYRVSVDPQRIVVTTGSSAGFLLAFLCLFETGDRVAIPSPGYPAYRNILKALSLVPVEIETNDETGWVLSADALSAAHRRNRLAGVLVANPNNPNGTMIAPEPFADLLQTARDNALRFISDEIYHGLTYQVAETTALSLTDDAVVINSFSKYFCMTGWRIGWMVVPEGLVKTVDRLQQNLFICAPQISQVAAQAALDGTAEMEAVKQGYVKNRELFLERLPRLGIEHIQPIDGAFYAYGDISPWGGDSMALSREILKSAKVATTPGLDFDAARGGSWMRFSFAGETERMKQGFDRLDAWLKTR